MSYFDELEFKEKLNNLYDEYKLSIQREEIAEILRELADSIGLKKVDCHQSGNGPSEAHWEKIKHSECLLGFTFRRPLRGAWFLRWPKFTVFAIPITKRRKNAKK